MRGPRFQTQGLFALLAFAGMVELAYTTRTGPGVSPDSVQYLYAAHTFAEGRGFLNLYEDGGTGALTHYPPGYPMVLAAAALLVPSGQLTSAGTVLGIILWGINLFLVMWLLHRCTGRRNLALLVGFFLMMSVGSLSIHEMIWSEPLFFLLSLLALWKTAEHCATGRRADLVIAIVCVAVAAITRYIGVVLICSVAFVVLLRSAGGFWQRFRRAMLFGVLAALPMLAWLVRGHLVAGSMTNRSWGFHPMTAEHTNDLLQAIGEYFAQALQLREQSRVAGIVVLLVALVLCVRFRRTLAGQLRKNTFAFALVCCNLAFALFLAFSNTFLDFTPLTYRIVHPILAQITIAVVLLFAQWDPQRAWSTAVRKRVLALLVVYGAAHAFQHWRHVVGKDGPDGYFSGSWATDPVLAYLMAHPEDAVHSNAIDALYIHTGRILPQPGSLDTAAVGTCVAIFKDGGFFNGRSFDEDLSVANPYAPSVQLDLLLESPTSRLYRVR